MTRKIRNTTLGFYLPSFIRMHVGTYTSLTNLNVLDDSETEPTYLHEFTHFIQDVSTTYGYFNTYVIGEYMRMANNAIIANAPGPFTVPIQPVAAATNNVAANLEMSIFLSGSGHDNDARLTPNPQLRPETITTHNGRLQIHVVEIEYVDGNGNTNYFDFGELCVSESMAYLLERECYPNCPASPDLPYKAAEKLVDLVYAPFGQNRLNILALCDLSLMQQNPGKFFYETLLEFQATTRIFNSPEDIYAWYRTLPNIDTALNQFAPLAQQHLTSYLSGDLFVEINAWLNNMLTIARNYRAQNPTFILDIARGGRIRDNVAFNNFLRTVGSPLVTNRMGETTVYNPNTNRLIDSTVILALDQVHSIFWGLKRNCDLVGICSFGWHHIINICNTKKPKVDMRCATEPWSRSADNNLCPLGRIWRHWGLTGYYPE